MVEDLKRFYDASWLMLSLRLVHCHLGHRFYHNFASNEFRRGKQKTQTSHVTCPCAPLSLLLSEGKCLTAKMDSSGVTQWSPIFTGVPDLQNYINGAVGPDAAAAAAQESQQEQSDIERGVAPQQDSSMVESASPEKEEEMGSFENSQAFQPVMPVPVQAYTGSNQNIFGPMVPVTPGAYPMPGANDGYGGNQAVRSDVPDDDDEKGSKKSKINKKKHEKKQFIHGM